MKKNDPESKAPNERAACNQRGLKISARTRYGLRILLDIAAHDHDPTPRAMSQISQDQQISVKFISRLVIPLRQAGLIRSVRGSTGGFRLARSPEDITLLKVIETMQGPLSILDCLTQKGTCPREANCLARWVWEDVNTGFANVLSRVTIRKILSRKPNSNSSIFDFCI